MRKVLSAALVMAFMVSLFTACGSRGEGDEPALDVSVGSGHQEGEMDPSRMETENQLREGLAALHDKPDTQADQIAFYEELLARDLCREEDYLELAQLYADAGNTVSQRRMLWRAFRLYPGEAYVQQLEELVVQRTADEESAATLITALQQALTGRDAVAFRMVISGADWREIFQEAPEIYATRTCYTDEKLTAQIASDAYETEIFLFTADGECLYGRLDEEGSLIGSAVYTAGAYNGDAEVCWFDAESTMYKRYQAVLRNDVCVDSISVEYDGVSYTGALGEDGSTKEQQQEKVTQAGGVVYAYQEGGSRYLYQEDATKESFRMDCASIGLPRAVIWE